MTLEDNTLARKVTYIKDDDLPDGFVSLSKHIQGVWTPLNGADALNANAFAKRIVVESYADLWVQLPKRYCTIADTQLKWKLPSVCAVSGTLYPVVRFKVPIMDPEAAIKSLERVVLVNDALSSFIEMSGSILWGAGNIVLVGGKLVRELLADWCEVIVDKKRLASYTDRYERDRKEEVRVAEVKRRDEAERQRADNINSRTNYLIDAYDGVVRELAEFKLMKQLPKEAGLNLRRSPVKNVARKVWGLSPCEVVKRFALRNRKRLSTRLLAILEYMRHLRRIEATEDEIAFVMTRMSHQRARHKRYLNYRPALAALWDARKKILNKEEYKLFKKG